MPSKRNMGFGTPCTDVLMCSKACMKAIWPDPEQKLVAEYMDVMSLCRTDSAMTRVEKRNAWQKALKGLKSVAMNKLPLFSIVDRFREPAVGRHY